MQNRGFNIIGFNRYTIDTKEYRHCSIHNWCRLKQHKTNPDLLFCSYCGSEFPVKIEDSTLDQNIESDLPTANKTMIVSAKRKKKYYDSFANLIPEDDKDAMADLASGKTIVYYHEQKAEENKDKVVSVRKYRSDLI